MLVGFKSMTVRILDGQESITKDTNLFVFEGEEEKGASQKVDIKGLSPEVKKAYGSNIAYYISRKGTGDVEADFEILDLRLAVYEKLLGYKKSGKLGFIGTDTEAPYCSILLESEELDGTPVYFGFFKGTFSKEELGAETLKENTLDPTGDKLKFAAVHGETGDAKGQVLGYYIGRDEQEVTKLKQLLNMVAAG